MITPSSFAIHVTYTCPLTCAHCCFSSSPANRDRLEPQLVLDAIGALDHSSIELVAFTGGEPFLLGRHLVDFVRTASSAGFATRIVTSGFFGTSIEIARKRLEEVVLAGLNELSISWDDFHEEFVSFDTIRNVIKAAKAFHGLRIAIAIVQAAKSRWTVERVREELETDVDDVVCDSPLNLTGRAAKELKGAGLRHERYVGPCPYVLTGPTLSAKGKLLACCGVIPDSPRLCINPNFSPSRLADDLEDARASVLFNWLYLRGPYAILEWISERYQIPIPPKEDVGGNCEACKILFENKEIDRVLDSVLLERAPEIFGELQLLASLGLAEPKRLMRFWLNSSLVRDRQALTVAPV